MLRSYWRVFLAVLVGLGLLGTGYGYHRFYEATEDPYTDERYQPARDPALPPSTASQQAQPRPYQPYCQNPQSQGDADLCAQWAAVKGIAETNRLTRLSLQLTGAGLFLAIVGGFLGVVGTYLLLSTLRETRRSTQATVAVNRPWLTLKVVPISHLIFDEHGGTLTLRVTFQNKGPSPALNAFVVAHLSAWSAFESDAWAPKGTDLANHIFDLLADSENRAGETIFPGEEGSAVEELRFEAGQLNLTQPFKLSMSVGVPYRFGAQRARTIMGGAIGNQYGFSFKATKDVCNSTSIPYLTLKSQAEIAT